MADLSIFKKYISPPISEINWPFLATKGIRLFLQREDLIDNEIQGNKWRKLKYNFLKINELNYESILTFGGAFSNHIAAVAAAGRATGIATIGIIRGNELASNSNPTLRKAEADGMKLIFVSREEYRDKEKLAKIYGQNSFVLPEGGTNDWAIKGASEIVDLGFVQKQNITHVCVSVGTGGTAAGVLQKLPDSLNLLAFSSLKLKKELVSDSILRWQIEPKSNLEVINEYHFGGYAKTNSELMFFIENFENEHQIPLEQVYTGKMLFGVYDLASKNFFKENSSILAIHTGGLQGKMTLDFER